MATDKVKLTAPPHPDRVRRSSGEESLARSAAGLLALQALPRVGPATALRAALVDEQFDSLRERHASAWPVAMARAQQILDDCERRGIAVLSLFDDRYPPRLRAIHDPPPLLYVRGSTDALLDERLVAVVGTREPTSFGCSATQRITSELAWARWGVVSGLARGIDTVAHETALRHGAVTVAVVAGGLDRIYPRENTALAEAITEEGGALVAEVAPGVRPQRGGFVARNRLQTGLSVAVIVTQTGIEGGTMHTVRHAAAQGRPVFCAKPLSRHKQSAGLWTLLRTPAYELCQTVPAWHGSDRLCARLGAQALAQPVVRDNLQVLLDRLEFDLTMPQTTPESRWWPMRDPVGEVGQTDAADEQASLFALSR